LQATAPGSSPATAIDDNQPLSSEPRLAAHAERLGVAAPGAPFRLRILVVDDDAIDREILRTALNTSTMPIRLDETATGAEAMLRLAEKDYDCVLVDYRLPDMEGVDLVATLVRPGGPACILITGQGSEAVAVDAMKRGASDYLSKSDLNTEALWRSILYAHSLSEARRAQLRAQLELERLALHDALTGLPNRALFQSLLDKAIAHARRDGSLVAVGRVDLDHFKLVNDTYGHRVGDEVLGITADRLRRCLRAEDTAARLGGDEFALIVTGLRHPVDLEPVVDRMAHRLRGPMAVAGRRIWIGASIGFCFGGQDAKSADDLLVSADLALYRAKGEGANRTCWFTAELDSEVRSRQELQKSLPEALANDRLVMYYQPMVSLRETALVGMEALVRWLHPEQGLMFPDRFLPMAREIGLLSEIGERAIDQVCRQLRGWRDRGLDTGPVSINLSPQQLGRSDVVGAVRDALARWGLPPSSIAIEITEDVLYDRDRAVMKANLEGLGALGVDILLDDFGTGFASLAELRHSPVSCLKIDRSFVRDLGDGPEAAVFINSIVDLARGLRKRVIAEGVETEVQAAQLRRLGVPVVQGFLFGRPCAPEDAERFLPRRQAPAADGARVPL